MTQYYVRFTDATGVVISGDTPQSQWFEVSNPAFGSVQMLTIGSQTTGTGAGKVTFTGLNVTLGASALTEKLDLALEAGRSFKTIELVGYDNTSAGLVKTSSTVFKLAGGALDFVDIINGTHTLNFQYGGVVESVATYGQTGQLTGTTTAGWSLINNIRDDSTTFDAHARTDDPIVNGATTSAVVPEASGSHRVFIQLRNFDGTPLSGLGSSWIEVDSAVTSQLQFPNIGSGTSGTTGAGRVAFNPLDVVLKSGSLAPSLDQALALGKPFQVELAVYGDAGGGSDVLLDDYQFGLAGLKESGFANGSRNYSFEYGSERMVHSIYDPNGAYLRSEVEGWDYVRNVKLTAPSGSDTSFDAQKAPAALSGLTIAAPAPEVTQYYVRFTDQNGNVITGDTANGQWFAVSDANYRLEQTLLISPLLPGVGAGKVTFDDLSLSLGTSTLTQAIDHALKAGIAFKTIELVGYNESGKTPLKVSSTVFKLAGASGDSIDPQSGTHTFTFGYGDMVESIRTFDATGAVTGTVTAGWDRVKNVRDDSVTYDAKDRTDDPYLHGAPTDKIVPASSGGHDVYLQIRNFDGSALAGLGKQWIKVDAAIVDQLQTLAISSQTTGIGAGKVTFDPLKLVFDPGSLSPLLDKAMAQDGPTLVEVDMTVIGPYATAFGGPPAGAAGGAR